MTAAVYGASGYTGALVAAELRRRGMDVVLSGRSAERLDAVAGPGAEIRPAAVDDPATLAAAFAGCDAVINCAGPFTTLGEPVVRAAIAAGCHYVDTTAEQLYIKRIFDGCAADAERAGVTVIPAMGYDIVPGDLISHLTGERVEPVQRLTLAYDIRDFGMTRGSMHSVLEMYTGGDLAYRDGGWCPAGRRVVRPALRMPGEARPSPMGKWPGGEIITVPRHLRVRDVEVVMRGDALIPRALAPVAARVTPAMGPVMRSPVRGVLERLIRRLPEGPAEDRRRAARFTFVADAVGEDGRQARGVVQGGDVYGITAVMAVEGVRRLLADGAPAGVLAPAQAFDPAGFLDGLGEHGLRWSVEGAAAAA